MATSYDKYDPGYGIYDDGFSHNDYGRYRAASKYAVKHVGYGGARPGQPKPGRMGAYGHAPSPTYYSPGFYWKRMDVFMYIKRAGSQENKRIKNRWLLHKREVRLSTLAIRFKSLFTFFIGKRSVQRRTQLDHI